METIDSQGTAVFEGDEIEVLSIDQRILQHLPLDEVEELKTFIGKVFEVQKINNDGSMVVCKQWHHEEVGLINGHEVGIFPKGSLKRNK